MFPFNYAALPVAFSLLLALSAAQSVNISDADWMILTSFLVTAGISESRFHLRGARSLIDCLPLILNPPQGCNTTLCSELAKNHSCMLPVVGCDGVGNVKQL